jgi:predicted  nucleic acid-binding Zn-ribbon protein
VISTYHSKAQVAADTLKQLRGLAKCDDDQQLETTITAAEKKTEKQEEYDRIAVGLIERNALSDVGQVEEEASGYGLDSLRSEIKSSEDRLKALQDEVFETGSEHGKLLQEFERLQSSSDESTLQAQKAEDALARVRPAVAQYLRLRLASEVLQRAI